MKYILILAVVVLYANAVLTDQPSALEFDEEGELYQRDMSLDEEELAQPSSPSITKRKAMNEPSSRWPNAQVPYRFGDSAEPFRAAITRGMQHWEANTCVKFNLVTSTYRRPHIIFDSLNSCSANVGRNARNPGQFVSIRQECSSRGGVAHEIGHALGFRHEHVRPDRDQYVKVLLDNADYFLRNRLKNFDVQSTVQTFGVPYDYGSVMHYGSDWLAESNKNTMVTLDPFKHFFIGQRVGLSFWDIKLANLMYNCDENCTGVTCVKGGFVDRHCRCVCPPGFSGGTCQYGSAIPIQELTCGSNVTQPTTIGKITTSATDTKCVWVVKAPAGQKVKAVFKKFQNLGETGIMGQCKTGYLELRLKDLYDGRRYCEDRVGINTSKTSVSNTMVFVMYTPYTDSGFKADITFV